MYSFIVLGLIPGTNIQITFTTWLNALLLGITAILVYRLYHLLSLDSQVSFTQSTRKPLFAQQLHTRGL